MAKRTGFTRREFLRAGGAAALTLRLANLALAAEPGPGGQPAAPPGLPPYRDWEDLYRQEWRWDRIVRGTHTMTNCVSGCAWDLYVKDGVVWREEQKASYTASTTGLPDFNPRGCQKGACGAWLMYSPSRVRYPLRRVGPRGAGKWRRTRPSAEMSVMTVLALMDRRPSSWRIAGASSAMRLRSTTTAGSTSWFRRAMTRSVPPARIRASGPRSWSRATASAMVVGRA